VSGGLATLRSTSRRCHQLPGLSFGTKIPSEYCFVFARHIHYVLSGVNYTRSIQRPTIHDEMPSQ
jgi:hypothetical protein